MHYLLHRFGSRYGRSATGFTERTVDRLMAYNVPGNIRELENMIERAVILLADGGPIDVAHMFSPSGSPDIPFYGLAPDGRLTLGESGQLPLHGRARSCKSFSRSLSASSTWGRGSSEPLSSRLGGT